MRDGKNPHISNQGLQLAYDKAKNLPTSFDVVLSSISSRAIETSIALGFSITDTINFKNATPNVPSDPKFENGFDSYQEYKDLISTNLYFSTFSDNLVNLITEKLKTYSEAQRILLVTHGGVIECSTIGFLPNYDYKTWGLSSKHCEGVKLQFKNNSCVFGEKLN
jgi:broad specificity phosphatase PhoE